MEIKVIKLFKNYKGMWEAHFSDGVKAEYTTKKGIEKFIKKHLTKM